MRVSVNLFLLSLFLKSAVVFSQINGEDYSLKKSWSFGIGIADYSIDGERFSIVDWGQAFSSLMIPQNNYSNWTQDEHIASEPGLLPTCFFVDYSNPLNKAKSDWLKSTEWRTVLSIGYSGCFEGNMQKITGNTNVGGVFTRDIITVQSDATMMTLHSMLNHQTRHYGKAKRVRFGFGLGMSLGVTSLMSYAYEVNGTYVSTGDNSDYHYWNYYPANAISHSWHELGSARGTTIGLGFDIPFSMEYLMGVRKRFHLGFQFYFGNMYLKKFNGQPFTIFNMNGGLTFRFDLDPFRKLK